MCSTSRCTLTRIFPPGRRRNWRRRAPNSHQARELNAESLELQGKWDQAASEYQKILEQNPRIPGIHFRVARLLLSKPNPSPTVAEDAKRELKQEIEIDPNNAGAEYVLGELARQESQWPDAIAHFTRAAKLDTGFGDAYLGLGVCLLSAKQFSEAVAPLGNRGQAGAAKPFRTLQSGDGVQPDRAQTGSGQGVCCPSANDAEGRCPAGCASGNSA